MEFDNNNYYGHCGIQPNVELAYIQTPVNSHLQQISHHHHPQQQHQQPQNSIQTLNQLDLDRHLSSSSSLSLDSRPALSSLPTEQLVQATFYEQPLSSSSTSGTSENILNLQQQQQQFKISISTKKPKTSVKTKKASPVKTSPKKRPRNPDNWIRNANSHRRTKGLEYQTRNGKTVPAKVFADKPCNCSMKCNEKIGSEQREKVMKDFYRISQNVMQNLFIRGLVKANPVKQRRPVNQSRKEKSKSFVYYIRSGGIDIRVCKRYFADTFQISDVRIYKCTKSDDIDSVFEHRGHKIPWNKNKKQPPRKPKQKRPPLPPPDDAHVVAVAPGKSTESAQTSENVNKIEIANEDIRQINVKKDSKKS